MMRASAEPAARAVDRLLLANKPAPERCECDQAIDLQRRIFDAKSYIVAAIVRLAEEASSPVSSAGLALGDCRRALSTLENDE